MRRIFLLLLSLIFFSSVANAAESNLETERVRLICALSSLAAYSGDEGTVAKNFLERRGWEITDLKDSDGKINVKLHLMSKGNEKIFFFTGTEDLKDVAVDLNVELVPLNDADKNILVHRGFKDYADAALSGGNLETLLDYMKKNPDEKIYITGHSLGGAIAIISAVKLADAGADMSRIEVVTFGAPSVGNKEFAVAYQGKINLTRIFMKSDPISKTLKIFGYEHFGEAVNYKEVEEHRKSFHAMILYLDRALRNYYDAGGFGAENDLPLYIAPIGIAKDDFKNADKKYLKLILRDSFGKEIDFAEIKNPADFAFNVTEYLTPAKNAGCKYVISQMIQAKPIRDSRPSASRIIVQEMVYDLEGFPVAINSSSFSTEEWTVLEAILFAQENLSASRKNLFN